MAASAAVVASDAVGRGSMDSPRDEEEACGVSLHERLVAYVHTLTHGSRRGVCSEHSYARARGAAAACRVRSLLAPVTPRTAPLDVERLSPPPAEPPGAATPTPPDSDDTDAEEGDWEESVRAAAPTSLHAQLADAAVDTIHSMRLTRLASSGVARREREREAARRLRRALVPYWSGGAPAWLHATLVRQLPRAERSLYDEAVGELRRAVPRLAARLTGVRAPSVSEGVPSAPGGAVGPESSPWLVWVSSGDATLDARWEPRLATLVHTRVLRGAGGAPAAEPAPPEPWCAAAAAAVRSALTDALAEAGSRSIILGGVGAGAAVALVLARGAGGAGRAEGGVRGLALVAPPLSTAEGARDGAEDALAAVRLPLLLVCGARAADCVRAAALRVAAAPDRRLLEVRCADHRLRLPPRLRAAKLLPQHALDAALAEEVVRWAVETAEREEEPASLPAERRRAHALHRDIVVTDLSEEFSHLPAATPAPAPAPPAAPPQSSGHAVPAGETRVVSRVSGGTPLLLAPRRPARPASALQPADILQLPIVFADDETSPPPTDTNITQGLTVTSGTSEPPEGVNFTRVILAKRGGGASRAARRVLVRRPASVRLVRAPRP